MRLPLTRLTSGEWDDTTPALSPDGTRLAFASNRGDYWDLYILELATGEITRLTDTPQYDSSPSWSPDGQYLAYETYVEHPSGDGSRQNLEIAILPLSGEGTPIPLSEHPAADFSPAWSPLGRQIAFISTRSGEREVWLADLDRAGEERFTNLSNNSTSAEAHPAWSPDGEHIAWSAVEEGDYNLYLQDRDGHSRYAGSGDWPAFSHDGENLIAALLEPNQTLLAGYATDEVLVTLPPLALPGKVSGLSWSSVSFPASIPVPLDEASRVTPDPSWVTLLEAKSDVPNGRYRLVDLEDVAAPYPQLHDLVDESFQALRQQVGWEAGWDFLANLENAFVPLTSPLAPGMGEDWLYTGKAFAFSPLPLNSGWAVVIPEQYGHQTYWQIYLKARHQDGSQGAPIRERAWDFNARFAGDPLSYEGGGKLTPDVPAGYWIDFTALASAYGWERLPALSIWRSAYYAARFNEFVFTGDSSWRESMQELYPPEALLTPTAVPAPTLTPTSTPWRQPPP
jgi:TolB protein